MNRSLLEVGGSALVVSQFTLAANTKGNRPGFSRAASPEQCKMLYEQFARHIANRSVPVSTGMFGADNEGNVGKLWTSDDLPDIET